MRLLRAAAFLVPILALGHAWSACAQDPTGVSICDSPSYRGTAIYNQYCGSANTGSSNSNAAAAAAQRQRNAAAAAQKQRDADELEQQRIDAENQRRAEEAEKQAKFDQDKQQALKELKGTSKDDDLDSGLKGVGSTDFGLMSAPSDSLKDAVADKPVKPCTGGGSTNFFGTPGNPSNPDLDCSNTAPKAEVHNALDSLSSAANSSNAAANSSRSDAAKTKSGCALDSAACATYTPVRVNKPIAQSPGAAELAKHIPDKAKSDPAIQINMAYYKKLDGQIIETKSKLAAVQQQIKSGTGDPKVLDAEKAQLNNELKRDSAAETTTEAQIKEHLNSINMPWNESPESGPAPGAKATP